MSGSCFSTILKVNHNNQEKSEISSESTSITTINFWSTYSLVSSPTTVAINRNMTMRFFMINMIKDVARTDGGELCLVKMSMSRYLVLSSRSIHFFIIPESFNLYCAAGYQPENAFSNFYF